MEATTTKTKGCCEYFQEALDPNIRRAFLGYCKAREWPFTVMVPLEGLEGQCPKPPIPKNGKK